MAETSKKVAVITTSAAYMGDHPTGVWLEEMAVPYAMFVEKGYVVTLASIKGGPIPVDAGSMADNFMNDTCRAFLHDPKSMGAMSHSVPVADLNADNLDAIFMSGGHGTVADFIEAPNLKALIEAMNTQGKIVASVCHGPLCFVQCKGTDGEPLVKGKAVTGFTDSEEAAVQLDKAVPFLLESKLKELGGNFERADDWTPKCVVDGNLITGQNPQSSHAVAEAVVAALSK